MANLGKIIYLSEAQKNELFINGSVTSNGTTITYNENDIYVTPDKSIDTIRLNGNTYTPLNGSVDLGAIGNGLVFTETITETTPTLVCLPNIRYICGEVSLIDITPPAKGTCDIVFTSGSTATILTVPSTVKFPSWFDATALRTETIYEIMITDGIYGTVMTWAN